MQAGEIFQKSFVCSCGKLRFDEGTVPLCQWTVLALVDMTQLSLILFDAFIQHPFVVGLV